MCPDLLAGSGLSYGESTLVVFATYD